MLGVSAEFQVGSHGIEASWAGGYRGREVTDRFIPQIPQLLSPHGVCYLLVLKENDLGEFNAAVRHLKLQFIVHVIWCYSSL